MKDDAQKYRDELLENLVTFEQIEQCCESDAFNKDEVLKHARDSIAAIEKLLGGNPKQER